MSESINNDKKTNPLLDPVTKKFAVGNPGGPGAPKGTKHLSTLLFKALQKEAKDGKTYQDLLIERILTDAIIKGKGDIIKLAMNYIDGMPDQAIDLSSGGEKINSASTDILAMAAEINKRLKAKKTENE